MPTQVKSASHAGELGEVIAAARKELVESYGESKLNSDRGAVLNEAENELRLLVDKYKEGK